MKSRLSFSRSLIIFFFLFSTGCFSAFGESPLDFWYQDDSSSVSYLEIRDSLEEAFLSLEGRRPLEILFVEKLREGSRKRVPALSLAEALTEESRRLCKTEALLAGREMKYETPDEELSFYRGVVILLSGGLSEEIITHLLKLSLAAAEPSESFLSSGHCLLTVKASVPLSEGRLAELGEVLIESRLTPASYNAVSSLFLKGLVQQQSPEEILDIIIDNLTRGRNISRIERELNRRSGR